MINHIFLGAVILFLDQPMRVIAYIYIYICHYVCNMFVAFCCPLLR